MLEILDLSLTAAGALAAATGAQVAALAGIETVFSASDLADGHRKFLSQISISYCISGKRADI
jgi:hypothetical protein